MLKSSLLVALGAIMLVLLIALLGGVGERMASLIEAGICWIVAGSDNCRLRGAHLFLISTIGLLLALVSFGLIYDRFFGRR